jgi:hypothetical protein
MKNLTILFSILTIISCADELEYPSTYEYASTSIDSYYSYQVNNNEFVEVENSNVPEPQLTFFENSASISKLEIVDDKTVLVTDGFNTEELNYTGKVSRIFMDKDGQSIELEGVADGSQFEVRSIMVGDFDGVSQNVYISSICGDITNCFDVNPSQWINVADINTEGKVQYVVIRRDVLKKV